MLYERFRDSLELVLFDGETSSIFERNKLENRLLILGVKGELLFSLFTYVCKRRLKTVLREG